VWEENEDQENEEGEEEEVQEKKTCIPCFWGTLKTSSDIWNAAEIQSTWHTTVWVRHLHWAANKQKQQR